MTDLQIHLRRIVKYRLGLQHRSKTGILKGLLYCSVVILLGYHVIQPAPLLARRTMQTQEPALVTQEFRYHIPEAGEVFFVWGINGWNVVPEEIRPSGTVVENKVMHTPMVQEGDTFVATVQVPAGTTLDYGFQTRKTKNGIPIKWVWDGDYHLIPQEDDVVEVKAAVTLASDQTPDSPADIPLVIQEIRYHRPEAGEVYFVWGINGWQIVPEEIRPTGTFIKDKVLYTPMALYGDTFILKMQIPAGATIDYGFMTTKLRDGTDIEPIWEADGEQDFHTIATQNNVVEVQTSVILAQGHDQTGLPVDSLPLLIGLSLILVTGTTLMLSRGSASTNLKPILYSQRLIYLRDLLRELVARDIKLRYKGSFLGVAWSLINPLVQLLVLGFVFGHILPLGIPNYTAFLFIGLLTWSWLQSSLFAAATAIIDGRSLIKRPGFPAAILPIVTVSANLIHFLLALPVLFLFLVFVGIEFAPVSLILPVIIILQFAFTLGLAYFIATFHVTFRDTQHLVGVFLLLAFYLTPIFYDASLVPERLQPLFRLNPILHLLDAYRAVLLYGELPNFAALMLLALLSVGLIFFGYRVFLRTSYRFIEEL